MLLRLIQSNAILNFIMFNVLISNLGFLKLLITYEIIANFPWCKYKRAFRGCNRLFIWMQARLVTRASPLDKTIFIPCLHETL
jgi:hypothetical protein